MNVRMFSLLYKMPYKRGEKSEWENHGKSHSQNLFASCLIKEKSAANKRVRAELFHFSQTVFMFLFL